jgi:hypothetical protein
MPTINLYGITLDTGDYGSGIITSDGSTALNSSIWNYSTNPTVVGGTGINIEVCITNLTSGNQRAQHVFTVKTGMSVNEVFLTGIHYWSADNIVTRWPRNSGTVSPFFWGRNATYPIQFKVPFMGVDDGIRICSVSCNYKMPMEYVGLMTDGLANYSLQLIADRSPNGDNINGRAPVDWYASGESRCFNIYIGISSGITNRNCVQSISQYAEWYKSNFPYNHPPRINGRILGINLSQGDQASTINTPFDNDRKYHSSNPTNHQVLTHSNTFTYPYNHPKLCSGWIQLLTSWIDYKLLKQNNYNGVMLWGTSGTSGSIFDFFPSIVSNLPDNLYNTLTEINTWSQRRNINVYFWAGQALGKYQLSGWNSDLYNTLSSGYYNLSAGSFNLSNNAIGRWCINPTGHDQIVRNFHSGVFLYTNGAGLDACPPVSSDPWVTGYTHQFRQQFPNSLFSVESVLEDISLNLCPNCYFPHTEFKGRCAFLEEVTSGYQPLVVINYFTDFYNPMVNLGTGTEIDAKTSLTNRVVEIENNGGCVIQGFELSSIIFPTSYILPNNFEYHESLDFTNKTLNSCDITSVSSSDQNIILSTGFNFHWQNLYNFIVNSWSSGYDKCLIDARNILNLSDIRYNSDYVVDRILDTAASAFIQAKLFRGDLDIGWLGYPCLFGINESINYESDTLNPLYISGYLNWTSGINRINYRYGVYKPWYNYTNFISPNIIDVSGGDTISNYNIWSLRNIYENSLYLAQNVIHTYPIYSPYYDQSEPFAGKPVNISGLNYATNNCINYANGIILYSKNPSVQLSSGIWKPVSTGISNWNIINSGAFNIKLGGSLISVTGLNFTSVSSYDDVANIVQNTINSILTNINYNNLYFYPFKLGTIDVKWNVSNYFNFSLNPELSSIEDVIVGTISPPDNLFNRTFIEILDYSGNNYTNINTSNLLGLSSGFTYGNRNIDEWTNWATSSNWWTIFSNGLCSEGDTIHCTSMWPEEMWPSEYTMWPQEMWPYCIENLIDLTSGCICIIPIDLIRNDYIEVNYLYNQNIYTNMINKDNIDVNYIYNIIENTSLIKSYDINIGFISTTGFIVNLTNKYNISSNLIYNNFINSNLQYQVVDDTNFVNQGVFITDMRRIYTLSTALCINNSDCNCQII